MRRLSPAAFVGFVCSLRSASARRLRWHENLALEPCDGLGPVPIDELLDRALVGVLRFVEPPIHRRRDPDRGVEVSEAVQLPELVQVDRGARQLQVLLVRSRDLARVAHGNEFTFGSVLAHALVQFICLVSRWISR